MRQDSTRRNEGSDILVGLAPDFAGRFATAADFADPAANPLAQLGTVKITGRKLPKGTPHPAYVTDSHLSAPIMRSAKLANVAATANPIVHVHQDFGTLTVTRTTLVTDETILVGGKWKAGAARPAIWEVA